MERHLHGLTALCLAAENHDGTGSKVFHPIDAQLADLGTIKSRRNKRADILRTGGNLIFLLRLLGLAIAVAENTPKPANARKTPAKNNNTPIKTRRLKKADREADFFFMNGCNVWMEFKSEASL